MLVNVHYTNFMTWKGEKREKRMAKLFRKKFNSYIPGTFIYQSLCIYDEHDLVNIYKDWPVVV